MKNLSIMHKGIIGVLFVVVVLSVLAYMQPVDAATYSCEVYRNKFYNKDGNEVDQATFEKVCAQYIKRCESRTVDEDTLSTRYGISINDNGNNSYTIAMNPPDNKKQRCKTSFTLVKVNDTNKNIALTCDSPITITETNTTDDTMSGLPGVKFTLKTYHIVDKENQSNSCYFKEGTLTLEVSVEQLPTIKRGNCPAVEVAGTSTSINYIDCSKTYPAGSFEQKFCTAKRGAENSHNTYKDGSGINSNGDYSGDDLTFKCDYDLRNISTNPDDYQGENYFANKKYIYGEHIETVKSETPYVYNYAPGATVYGEYPSCKIICEEAVEVEYGPPVASTAGACFSYKVRVTSRVSCGMKEASTPPPAECNYYTPTPRCVTLATGQVWLQGGPNEEFDSCVKSCDGGKYTKKCSNKCYKKVYGNTKGNSKVNNSTLNNVGANKLASQEEINACLNLTKEDGSKYNPYGCYYVTAGGAIEWYPTSTPHSYNGLNTTGEGRWYTENPYGKYHWGEYVMDYRGFWRHNFGNGVICQDDCRWIVQWPLNYYINPGQAEEDYKTNIENYNRTILSCKKQASCRTSEAEFTINVDYTKKGKTEPSHITFPYDTKKDTVKHTGDNAFNTSDNPNSTLLPNYPVQDVGLLGCYKSGAPEQNLYRTTWGFPGTWKNKKTGEISYNLKEADQSTWYLHDKQFCVPGDAQSVNALWWNAYKHKQMVEEGLIGGGNATTTSISAISSDVVEDECHYSSSIYSVTEINYNDPSAYIVPSLNAKIDYNIHAIAKNFGYFGWNIQMDCFYAINDDPICVRGCCVNNTCGSSTDEDLVEEYGEWCTSNSGYRIRSTDPENLFPSPDGEELATPEKAGRTTGFNWSTYAFNNKNTTYKSDPVAYMAQVQAAAQSAKTSGGEFYTDDKLDYEFTLSPKDLRAIRKDHNQENNNYTAFNGSFAVDKPTGVSRYRSDMIRGLGSNNKIPSDEAIRCNNMINVNRNECDPVHNGS